jgi:Thioesterase-like superfamily
MRPSLFTQVDGVYHPTELARGPWSPDFLHGGAVSALVAQLLGDELAAGAQPARFAIQLLRPVPLAPLSFDVRPLRRGRRMEVLRAAVHAREIQVAEATLLAVRPDAADGDELCRGTAASTSVTSASDPLDLATRETLGLSLEAPTFLGDAMQVRYSVPDGGAARPRGWFRLAAAPYDGVPATPLARVAAAADLTGSVAERRGTELVRGFVNADIGVDLARPPRGEWLCLEACSLWATGTFGQARAEVLDEAGLVGATHSVLVAQPGNPEGTSWSPRRWTRHYGVLELLRRLLVCTEKATATISTPPWKASWIHGSAGHLSARPVMPTASR